MLKRAAVGRWAIAATAAVVAVCGLSSCLGICNGCDPGRFQRGFDRCRIHNDLYVQRSSDRAGNRFSSWHVRRHDRSTRSQGRFRVQPGHGRQLRPLAGLPRREAGLYGGRRCLHDRAGPCREGARVSGSGDSPTLGTNAERWATRSATCCPPIQGGSSSGRSPAPLMVVRPLGLRSRWSAIHR